MEEGLWNNVIWTPNQVTGKLYVEFIKRNTIQHSNFGVHSTDQQETDQRATH